MSSHQKISMDHSGISSDGEPDPAEAFDVPEDELLYAARHGKEEIILRLLICSEQEDDKKVNVNCKGREKSNRGWTPLHLAAYFGHTAAVRVLLEFGAGLDILNSCGESALHLAAYTGREEVVGLLLQHGADTNILNTQGQKPRDVAKTQHIVDMINAAESTASLRIESEFLEAAATGESEILSQLLTQSRSVNINARDTHGNSALHLAALRGHGPAAVLLLQHGIDSNIRNKSGQLACDVAQDPRMKQVLALQSIKEIYSHPQRFEGTLLKKSRFVGFKPLWVVLDRGVLSYFQNRGDASTGAKRKGMKYLDEATVFTNKLDPGEIRISFSDGSSHSLHLEPSNASQVALQKWLNALREHISFSTHYTHHGKDIVDDIADDIVSLGTMQDSLQNAQAHHGHLDKQINMLKQCIEQISKHLDGESASKSRQSIAPADLRIVITQCLDILKSSHNMYQALSHCMALLSQQEELRQNQLREERERCRMLQDSLHALATEHHELEKSLSRRPSFLSSMDEEFFDCDDDDDYGIPSVEDFSATQTQGMVLDEANNVNCTPAPSYGRTTLPVPMFSRSDFSFWSILKQCIGKELSKITMPVVFNEPLSFIQRLAEYMEYAPLIEKAANCDNPIERMEYVAAFAVSALSSNWGRIGKPFNPLLGETYELDRPDLGFRFIGEQVSHHPPVTAFNADGRSYTFHGSIQPKLKFWGKSVEISPKGIITLTLQKYNETYTWQNVNCVIHNVIVGSLWVEHYGVMEITCNKSNINAVINFKQSGWFAKDLHRVEGFIYRGKVKERALYGTWVLGLYSCSPEAYDKYMNDINTKTHSTKEKKEEAKPQVLNFNYEIPGQKTLWKVNPRPPHSEQYYHFSLFAMSLNELTPDMASKLPPTDSRFRPDIRSMEEGKIDFSAEEKNRVEEKQREARNDRKKSKKEWQPQWFQLRKDPSTSKEDWVFDPSYWKRNWTQCADIF